MRRECVKCENAHRRKTLSLNRASGALFAVVLGADSFCEIAQFYDRLAHRAAQLGAFRAVQRGAWRMVLKRNAIRSVTSTRAASSWELEARAPSPRGSTPKLIRVIRAQLRSRHGRVILALRRPVEP